MKYFLAAHKFFVRVELNALRCYCEARAEVAKSYAAGNHRNEEGILENYWRGKEMAYKELAKAISGRMKGLKDE